MKGGGVKNTKAKAFEAVASPRKRHNSRMEKILKVDVHTPAPPAHFDQRQIDKWNDIVKKFVEAGIWQSLDADGLQTYVENWCIMEDLMQLIKEQGPIIWIETPQGKKPIRNPAHIAYEKAFAICKPFMEQFGMTPRARQSIIVQPKSDKPDPLDGL